MRNESSFPHFGGLVVASVELYDDGKRLYVTVSCDDHTELLDEIVRAVEDYVGAGRRKTIRSGMERIHLPEDLDAAVASVTARDSAQMAVDRLTSAGYTPMSHDSVADYFTRREQA